MTSSRRPVARVLSSLAPLIVLLGLMSGCRASSVGLEYYNQGNWEKATPKLREAVIQEADRREEILPYYVRSVVNLADGVANEGRHESALQMIKDAQELTRDNAELRKARVRYLLGFGRKSLTGGNFDLARSQAEEVLRIEPSNEGARKLRGDITLALAENALKLQKYPEALESFRAYLAEFPDDADVRRRTAQVHVVIGKRHAARGNARDALRSFAQALMLDPQHEPAIKEAIVAAEDKPRGLMDNYEFFLGLLPRHPGVKARLLEQLERRLLDKLDAQEEEAAKLFAFGSWRLQGDDPASAARHRALVLRIVEAQLKRGEAAAAITTLTEAATAIPPLAADLRRLGETIRREDEVFYVGLSDDVTFLTQLQSTMHEQAEKTTNPIIRSNISSMIRALERQVEMLRNVRGRRNRLLINRQIFEVAPDVLDRLEQAVTPDDFKTYLDLLDRYRQTQALVLPAATPAPSR